MAARSASRSDTGKSSKFEARNPKRNCHRVPVLFSNFVLRISSFLIPPGSDSDAVAHLPDDEFLRLLRRGRTGQVEQHEPVGERRFEDRQNAFVPDLRVTD